MERLELYFAADNVGTVASGADQAVINADDRKRVATLLTLVGPETYLLKSLVSPRIPADLLFQEITDTLKSHIKPRRLTVAERHKFHQRTQKDSEEVTAFAAELRRLASTRNFGEFLGEALRDQLVCGIRNSNTQRKLLSEDLSFDQAMQMAPADEVADAEAKQIAPDPRHSFDSTENTVSVVSNRKSRDNWQSPTTTTTYMRHDNKTYRKLCYRCNGDHPHQECRFKEATCHICHKKGHYHGSMQKNSETQLVNCTHDNAEYCLYNVKNKHTSHQPIKVGVHMDGKSVDMLVDTETGVPIINEATYRELRSPLPKLQASDINLTSCTGQSIKVLVQIVVTEYKQQSALCNNCSGVG